MAKYIEVSCNSCSVLVVNNTVCHENGCPNISGVCTVPDGYGLFNASCEQCGSYGPVEHREFKDFDETYNLWLCENC